MMSKIKAILCVFVGHSRIISVCWGYVSCARCEDQIGDCLAGAFDAADYVVVGHGCEGCHENWDTLTWRDKLLAPCRDLVFSKGDAPAALVN